MGLGTITWPRVVKGVQLLQFVVGFGKTINSGWLWE